MITSSEVGNIMYKVCSDFGPEVFQTYNLPLSPVGEQRLVVIPKPQHEGTYWLKSFCEVNWLVPDIAHGTPDMVALQDAERTLLSRLNGYGDYDGTPFRYKVNTTEIHNASDLKCHFVNARVKFEIMNVKF